MTTTVHPDEDPMNVAPVVLPDTGRYIKLPPVTQHENEPLAITATRLADFAMKMATGYTPDTGDPRRLAIYREILASLEDAQQHRPTAGKPIAQLAEQIVGLVESALPIDHWRMEDHHHAEAVMRVLVILSP